MATIKATGKVTIISGGDKGTAFRDSKGNFHAQFFNASIGGVCGDPVEVDAKTPGATKDAEGRFWLPSIDADTVKALGLKQGEYYAFRWNITAQDAEEFANFPMGTVFKATLTPKMVKDVAGRDVIKCYRREGSESVTFDCSLRDWDIALEGRHERRRFTQYIADVPRKDDEANAQAEAGENVEDK